MEEKINTILKDLYSYDPEFKSHEAELKKVLQQMLLAKPDTRFDLNFAENLRKEILIKASNRAEKPVGLWSKLGSFKILAPSLAVVALAVVALNYYDKDQNTPYVFQGATENTQLKPLAFGSLTQNEVAFGLGGDLDQMTSKNTASPESSADLTQAAPSSISYRPQSGGGSGMDIGIMPAYENYKFVYAGDALELTKDQVEVLRRIKGFGSNLEAGSFLSSFEIPNFNLNAFSNSTLDTLTLTEEKDFGYMLSLSFKEGTININENWLKWQTPDRLCQDEACIQKYRLSPNDIPSNEELISIANSFLDQYGINKANYGEPYVQNQWLREYEMAQDKRMAWIPDSVSVVYPFMVNGQMVYDESGNASGMMVPVNVRVKKASGVYELTRQAYESSLYPSETDWQKIVKLAEAGGNSPVYIMEGSDAKITEVKLGTPKESLVRQWKYEPGKDGYEILVPALVFPILDAPQNFPTYRTAVTIPLVKELLDSLPIGRPVPTPFSEKPVMDLAQ